jgi:hypothetical protein
MTCVRAGASAPQRRADVLAGALLGAFLLCQRMLGPHALLDLGPFRIPTFPARSPSGSPTGWPASACIRS